MWKSSRGMLINPRVVFTLMRPRWSSTTFSLLLALLVWTSNTYLHQAAPTFFPCGNNTNILVNICFFICQGKPWSNRKTCLVPRAKTTNQSNGRRASPSTRSERWGRRWGAGSAWSAEGSAWSATPPRLSAQVSCKEPRYHIYLTSPDGTVRWGGGDLKSLYQ